MNEGLKNSLNRIRELSSEIYHQYIPVITENTNIAEFGNPILEMPQVRNEFLNMLMNRIVYTQFTIKFFNNPLRILEGDRIPLGYAGQEIYVNPAKARKFNVNDFAGLLQKYEADVKVQYNYVNVDNQYCVTVTRHTLKQAFTSWSNLESFIDQLSNSLYNGAYRDQFLYTKYLVSGAYRGNNAIIETVSNINSEQAAKDFVTKARLFYLNFQTPSSEYNSWKLVGGEGRPIVTWTSPEDIVLLIRNDVRAYLDVNVLAEAFNMDKTDLLGRIIAVDNFNVYDDDGNMIFDGSSIIGCIGDKAWFKIKEQDMFLDEFYNANNRTWQYYLNMTKMYQYSLFANMVIFATSSVDLPITGLSYKQDSLELTVGNSDGLDIITTPSNANTPNIVYTQTDDTVLSLTPSENTRHLKVTGLKAGTSTITATAGSITTTIPITVTAPAVQNTCSKTTKASTKATSKVEQVEDIDNENKKATLEMLDSMSSKTVEK